MKEAQDSIHLFFRVRETRHLIQALACQQRMEKIMMARPIMKFIALKSAIIPLYIDDE
ncbi:MAG: hypothetical protein ACK49N_04555 [Verrucomicrobiota bacterium]